MRRHAKALAAGPTRIRPTAVVLALTAAVAMTLVAVAPVDAATVSGRPLLSTFDGSAATAGPFSQATEGGSIAVDNQTGAVYVAAGKSAGGFVSKFDPDGAPSAFAATGASSLFGFNNILGVAVDNSGGSGQGRLFVSQFGASLMQAYGPDGSPLWATVPTTGSFGDVAVDAAGHPWTSPRNAQGDAVEWASTGSPPVPTGCLIDVPATMGIDVDAQGNVYIQRSSSIRKYTRTASCSFTESTFDSSATAVYADQSSPTGHIFTVEGGSFAEYDSTGALLATNGANYVRYGASIAYNPDLDRVYVLQGPPSNRVAVFGPSITSTVPDVTEASASLTGAEVSTAHLTGELNPQGTASKWHFEWKSTAQAWDDAASSPPQSLPADSSSHAVEFDTSSLRGNTTYEVRLVGVNDATRLAGFSSVKTITTKTAPAAPVITPPSVASPGTTSAVVAGTINPSGDTADWHVQIQKACSGAFSDLSSQTLGTSSAAPEAVEYTATGLLPSERYCVKLTATNSFGAATSSVVEFETNPVVPDDVETAFAAPRTDTSARLNGRVNPEGSPLIYRFEYSDDGGATWTQLPAGEETLEGRSKIVLSASLEGLAPNTTYSYRFSAENAAGEASPQGEVKSFTTRPRPPAIEPCPNAAVRSNLHFDLYLPDCRAIELVSQPDRGNQNIDNGSGGALIAPSGARAVWAVNGGSPGGPNGARNEYLATRTTVGWQSTPLAPPASTQLGEGGGEYRLQLATPGFSSFLVRARSNPVLSSEIALARVDGDRNQQILRAFPSGSGLALEALDVSDDGAHVVLVDLNTHQLEDIGGSSPEVLSIMPDGVASECGIAGIEGAGFHGPLVTASKAPAGTNASAGYRMMATTDASRVYFEAKPNGNCAGMFGLYMRNRNAGKTILIDPGAVVNGTITPPEFIRTTRDGRDADFATASALDPSDNNGHGDVYRWDSDSETSTCVTCAVDANVELLWSGTTFSPVVASEDLSRVYFASKRALAPGATAGSQNVYALHGDSLRYIGANIVLSNIKDSGDGRRLSTDGSVFAFTAPAGPALTADEVTPGMTELYLYDDREGSVECVSCRRDGKTTHEVLGGAVVSAGGVSVGGFVVSADGSTVAFKTAEKLVPGDVNGGQDIYEWRNGSVGLLTDGVTQLPNDVAAQPKLRGISADGSNIFFTVAQPGLTRFELDGLAALYDARIGGGFLPPEPIPPCDGDSCQGPLKEAPSPAAAISANFGGRGNASRPPRRKISRPPRRCGRQAVRRGGRCVSKRALAKRACRSRRGKAAKRRCLRTHLKRHLPGGAARTHRNHRGSK